MDIEMFPTLFYEYRVTLNNESLSVLPTQFVHLIITQQSYRLKKLIRTVSGYLFYSA